MYNFEFIIKYYYDYTWLYVNNSGRGLNIVRKISYKIVFKK